MGNAPHACTPLSHAYLSLIIDGTRCISPEHFTHQMENAPSLPQVTFPSPTALKLVSFALSSRAARGGCATSPTLSRILWRRSSARSLVTKLSATGAAANIIHRIPKSPHIHKEHHFNEPSPDPSRNGMHAPPSCSVTCWSQRILFGF